MGKQKKSRKHSTIEKLVFATAILNLLKALVEIIRELTG